MKAAMMTITLCTALAFAGCGGGSGATSASTDSGSSSAIESLATTGAEETAVTIDKTKPKVRVPNAPPPKKLIVKDLEVGSGPAAEEGDELTIMYVGVFYTTGKLFSANWDWRKPTTFKLGAGAEGQGWEQGLRGMQVGGRRELIVPTRMTTPYAVPPETGPEGTLLYVIDLFAIQ